MTRLLISIFCVFASATLADTLTLRDGRTVTGDYAGGDTRSIRMMVGESVQTFRIGEVVSLTFGGSPQQTPAPPPDDSGLRRDHDRDRDQDRDHADHEMSSLHIPAGTDIVIRMIDSVNSETDQVGATFRASVDEPVVMNGQTVIPRDADVVVKLVEQHQAGKVTGRTSLTLALQQIRVDGNMVDVYSERITKASGSRGKKTAGAAGGGAALGAIIGGIAGGGTGAAIGAASGGALGTGIAVMTSGEKVKIPSETRLTFTLEAPVGS